MTELLALLEQVSNTFFNDYSSLHRYVPVFIFIIIAVGFGAGTLLASRLLGPRDTYDEKLSPYECGVEPETVANQRFSIRFYVVAILFVIFDIEAAFLFPWAVVFDVIGLVGFIEMMLFILVLMVGFAYAWRKGALEWV